MTAPDRPVQPDAGAQASDAEAQRCPIRQWHEPGEECLGHGPAPLTMLPCGCHLSRVDYNAVLCAEHEAEFESAVP